MVHLFTNPLKVPLPRLACFTQYHDDSTFSYSTRSSLYLDIFQEFRRPHPREDNLNTTATGNQSADCVEVVLHVGCWFHRPTFFPMWVYPTEKPRSRMISLKPFLALAAAALGGVRAGTTVWSGSFNPFTSAADFDKWSWSSQVGTYQWYIHGSQPTSHYLALDPSYKNPADTSETHGLKVTIDSTATWNSQMERTELIPQTTANLGTGNLFYHFSVKRTNTNPPNSAYEHQVVFFESHFTELKYGVSPNPTDLQWMIQGNSHWSTPFTADTWFNFAYDIDFNAKTVGLWASTGSAPLTKVVQNVATSPSTNSADWHVGVLRIVNDPTPEDWYFSGVYIESGPITTSVGNGSASPSSSSGGSPTTAPPSSSTSVPSTTPVSSTTSASGPKQTQWGQCGGTGYTGPTICADTFKCVAVSPPYYYQCQ
ncbi:hypothetical protein NLI96_g8972 [Meripilus lineatus]|uniref:CBM1 domain-containing protein n=1 Tax=Meripilus lineatus TaxID=2056292 RepID=A0AAD5YFS0_9APHY|nr:hypothetical protein NLI96_g8972 [Physisporinus lineatus]